MNFIPQYAPWIRPGYGRAVARQVDSGWVGPGEATAAFEAALAEAVGVPFAAATTSGTAALIIAIKALGLPRGSTILFPAYTFLAGANAARFLGHKVRLVDIKEDTLCMDPDQVAIGPDVGAVMFVNHNGYAGPDVARIHRICAKAGVPLIEDASQGLGIRGCGTVGDVSVLSFSVPKLVTTGQGGAVLARDEGLIGQVRRVIDHGGDWRKDRVHRHLGVNFKFNDVLAALGLAQMRSLDLLRARRKRVYDAYRAGLDLWPVFSSGRGDSTWMMVHRAASAPAVAAALKAEGIQAVQYYQPVSWNPPYRTRARFPAAEAVFAKAVYLPSSLTLTLPEIRRICRIVKNAR
jgi:perosamine synthetase